MKPMRLSNFGSLKAQFRAKWFKPQMDRWSKKQKKKDKNSASGAVDEIAKFVCGFFLTNSWV